MLYNHCTCICYIIKHTRMCYTINSISVYYITKRIYVCYIINHLWICYIMKYACICCIIMHKKDMLSCITIWNMMHDMLHCDIIPMNKGLWGYSVSIFEDEGRGRSSACSASPSPRAARVWRPPVGHPPLTTSTQGKVASRPAQTAASKR
jgi:hypothetical protein